MTIKTLVSCDRNLPWVEQIENLDILVLLKYATHINSAALPESTPSEFSIKYIDIGSVNSTGEIKQVGEFTFENSLKQ
jgi:type I restriction enzyme, S subunit